MFGFTGTPIFADNAVKREGKKHTTKELFHQQLHSYGSQRSLAIRATKKTLTPTVPDPDIVEMINRPLKVVERGPAKKRVLQKVVDYVDTFIRGASGVIKRRSD